MIFLRYIGGAYLRMYITCIFAILSIFILIDFVEKSPRFFNRYEADLWPVIKYYFFFAPQKFVLFSPLAVLLAVMVTLILFNRGSEIVSMRACGLSYFKITLPFFCVTFGIFLFNLYIINSIIPNSETKRLEVVQKEIRRKKSNKTIFDKNWIRRGNNFYHIGRLGKKEGLLNDVTIFRVDSNMHVHTKVHGDHARWNKGSKQWILHNLVTTIFSQHGQRISNRRSKQLRLLLTGEPSDFRYIEKSPEQMSIRELRNFVNRNEYEGTDVSNLAVELYLKVAFPFINIIMCLLGIPFAFTRERDASVVIPIVITLTVGLTYWVFLSMTRTLGQTGTLSPFLGAWMANVVFFFVGIFFFRRIQD